MTPQILEMLAERGKIIGQNYLIAEAGVKGAMEAQQVEVDKTIDEINKSGHAVAMGISKLTTKFAKALDSLTTESN